jgi:altronate dehydratase
VIKICGNPKTCDWMSCNIDVDASEIITQGKSIEEIGEVLWKKLKGVLNGELTVAERLGHNEMAIFRLPGFGMDLNTLMG